MFLISLFSFIIYLITLNKNFLYVCIGLLSYMIIKKLFFIIFVIFKEVKINYKAKKMFNTKNSKESYLYAWFFIYGHFCKIDGSVTKEMINELEDILSNSDSQERKNCIMAFNQGKVSQDISEVENIIRQLSLNPKIYLSFLKILCNLSFNYRKNAPSNILQKKILSFTENTTQHTYFNSIAEGIVVSSYHSAVTRKRSFEKEKNDEKKEQYYNYEDFFKTFREKQKEYNQYYKNNKKTTNLDSYFLVLGIDKNTNHTEAKKAYRKLMSQYHPDKIASLNDPELEKKYLEKSQSIQNAYEYLKNNFYKKETLVS